MFVSHLHCFIYFLVQDKFFSLEAGGGIQASEARKTKNGLFDLCWHQDGAVSFKASNGE